MPQSEWRLVATQCRADSVDIEVVCSHAQEHRRRIEQRIAVDPARRLPTWQDVECREYHAWSEDRLVIDTAGQTVPTSSDELIAKLKTWLPVARSD